MLSLDKQNRLREQYRQLNPGWRPATELYADIVRQHLHHEARVLDLGCGRGGLVEQLTHPLPQMIGIDPDWASLIEHRLDLARVVGVSEQLPFAAGSFDVIFASWVLEHLERPSLTFHAIRRILRPGGVFVFITPNGRHPLTWLNRGLGRFAYLQRQIVKRFYGRAADDTFPPFYRANSVATLQRLFEQNGLSLARLHTIPDPTYLAFNRPFFRFMCWFESTLPQTRQLHLVGVAKREI
jgi:SAM-dependent methyltransferase